MPALPPFVALLAGAFLIALTRGRYRTAVVITAPLVALALVWLLPQDARWSWQLWGLEVLPVKWTREGRLFGTVFSLMAFAGGWFALRQARPMELVAAYVYAGSALGVTTAGDLLTLFVFWELMALGSTVILWASDQPKAYGASVRYLSVHLLGGVLLLAGITGRFLGTGSLEFGAMELDSPSNALILAGFLLNAGAPPLSAWVADAYPEASPSGMVFLSAFTTKTAVYALLVGFPGVDLLIYVGLYMTLYGIVYALLENDMRRILAYNIVNQVGFMVAGVGIGTEMALNGAASHAFTHIIYEGLLLMSAGSVLYVTGRRRCTDLGGLFRTMPLTTVMGGIGALSISSFPFTSGFVSKSMISQGAADQHLTVVWFLLTAASAGVFLHAGIKFPWFVFFQKDSGLRPPEPPKSMMWPMALFAALCLFLGVLPEPLYRILPYPVTYQPYTAPHLVGQFQLLLFAGLAFFVMLPAMKRSLTISLDWDWFYRRLGPAMVAASARSLQFLGASLGRVAGRTVHHLDGLAQRALGPTGRLARHWPTSAMVLWVTVLLAAYLIFYLI